MCQTYSALQPLGCDVIALFPPIADVVVPFYSPHTYLTAIFGGHNPTMNGIVLKSLNANDVPALALLTAQ